MGIYIFNSNNNTIGNCTLSKSDYGISLHNSNSNKIFNNYCNNTFWGGISISGISNIVFNNTLESNNEYGIVSSGKGNKIIQNICKKNGFSGIYLWGKENKVINNSCSENKEYGIYVKLSDFNIILNNTCNQNGKTGIYLKDSYSNIIDKNYCLFNKENGCEQYGSINNTTTNNTFCNSSGIGLSVYNAEYNIVENNNCSYNNYGGLSLHGSPYSKIINNYCVKNNESGIYSGHSNLIIDNICNSNLYNGIYTESNSTVDNNTCNFNNKNGIYLQSGNVKSVISNNTLISNNQSGIFEWGMYYYSQKLIKFNTIKSNKIGIEIAKTYKNNIFKNLITNNSIGINVTSFSHYNRIYYNNIQNNSLGINLSQSSHYNRVYQNNIINNTIQGRDFSPYNYWNNSNHHGNYWSDYNGKDNGANSRIAGDGIGDTLIPHLNLDNYPFILKKGWFKPGEPRLNNPGTIDNDGYFNITWIATARTNGYILEEDSTNKFKSGKIIYNSSNLFFNLKNKQNGTFYYRIRAYNNEYHSSWSNIVTIIVDWLPDIPNNLIISVYPKGNTLNLSWDLNKVETMEYIIYYKTNGDWIYLQTLFHPNHYYNHTSLIDSIQYYYKIQAKDFRGQLSNFSNIASAIPKDITPPVAPTNLQAKDPTGHSVTLIWDSNTESDLAEYHLYMNNTGMGAYGPFHKIHTIFGTSTQYIVTGLAEITQYHFIVIAVDEVPNNSSSSNVASAITLDVTAPKMIHGSWNMQTTTGEDFKLFAKFQDNVGIDLVKIFYTKSTTWQEKTLPSSVNGNYSITNTDLSIDTTSDITPWRYYFYAEDTSGNYAYYGTEEEPFIIMVIDNDKPIADAGEEKLYCEEGKFVTFDASNSTDNIGIINYSWTFKYLNKQITLYGKTTGFTFGLGDEYEILLTISDAAGNKATDTLEIRIYFKIYAYINLISPKNRSIYAGPKVTLSWSASCNALCILTYDVYFGTSPDPPLYKSGLENESLDVLIFEDSVYYYWKVQLIVTGSPGPISKTFSFYASHAVPDFGVEITAEKNYMKIYQGDSGTIKLTIKNTPDRHWDWIDLKLIKNDFYDEIELSEYNLYLGPGEKYVVFLNFTTTSSIDLGSYQITINAKSRGATEYDFDVNETLNIEIEVLKTSSDDSDNDNLPDAWEENWFGDLELYDGSDDPDSDGKNNTQEYLNNTDPTTPNIGPDGKKPKEPKEEDNSGLYVALVLVPVLIIILILLLIIFLRKKKGNGQQLDTQPQESEAIGNEPRITSTEQQPQHPYQQQKQI